MVVNENWMNEKITLEAFASENLKWLFISNGNKAKNMLEESKYTEGS